jgi:hypothetical protein
MVYNLLQGYGFDHISRCRLLAQGLTIYPPLLGLDAKYFPIEQHAYWWRSCGFSFNADAQGYPLISEVVTYLRTQRTQTGEGGRVKVWSQEDLGNATGLRKETVYRMEHDRNPLILESMSRRAIVASALGTLAGENEPLLFRLFGLDPQAYDVPVPAHESVPVISLPIKQLTDKILQEYHQEQATFFTEYSTGHAQDTIGKVLEWIQQCQTLLSKANTTAQRVSLLVLESRYHQLLLLIANEQQKRERMLFHAKEAIKLAEYATTLPEVGDTAGLRTSHELLTAALHRTAMAHYGLSQYDVAQEYVDRALSLLPKVQSGPLKTEVFLDAALTRAQRVKSVMDQQIVFSYFKHANAASQSQPPSEAPDDNFTHCGKGLLYLRKAMALSAPKMKGVAEETVDDLLRDARRVTPPELIRRHVVIEVFQALAHFEAFEYEQATEVALLALEKSQQIQSRLNRNRIEGLYRQLLNTSFKDKPLLAYLGIKLRTWDHGMDDIS